MSTSTAARWGKKLREDTFAVDRHALLMAALFVGVQLGAIAFAMFLDGLGADPSPPGGVEGASAGAAWVTAEVLFAVLLLGLAVAYRRAPEWLQYVLKKTVTVAVILWMGWVIGPGSWALFGAVVGGVATILLLDQFDLYWMLNNVLAVGIAVYGGAVVGLLFGIEALLLALVGFSIYDHYFANKNTWMFTMADLMLRMRLPVVVFVPDGWRLDWNAMIDGLLDDREEDDGSWGIGTADLLLPASVPAAVAIASPSGLLPGGMVPALVVAAGVAIGCFRLRYEMLNHGSGAGLPALTSGTIGGVVLASLVTIGAGLA